MPDFDTVLYNSLKRHNTNNLSHSMYKIDAKYVPCDRLLTCNPWYAGQVSKFKFFKLIVMT